MYEIAIAVFDADPGEQYTIYDINPELDEDHITIKYIIGQTITRIWDGSLDGSIRDIDGIIKLTITTIIE